MNLHEWMQNQPSEADRGPCQRARDWVEEHQHLTLLQIAEALVKHPEDLTFRQAHVWRVL